MSAEIKEIPIEPLTVVGIIGTAMIPITTYGLLDASKRQEVITTILNELANNSVVILGNSLIRTECYDGFKVL